MALVCGMSKKEAMLSHPGEVYSLFELYLRANGLKEKSEPEDE